MFSKMSRPPRSIAFFAAAFAGAAFVSLGCSSSSAPTTSTAAAVTGAVDMHCTMNGTPIKQSIGMCMTSNGQSQAALAAADADTDASSADDAASTEAGSNDAGISEEAGAGNDSGSGDTGADTGDDGGDNGSGDYGPTLYNAEGDDDDCKYHVKWTSTAVKANTDVTFDVNVIRRIDNQPATGADVQIEAFLNDTHPTPTANIPNKESAGGNYAVGPLKFDASGMWTVRFHFYEMCSDDPEDSPHGHAAFYVNVP